VNNRQSYLAMIRAFPGGWDAMCAALGMSRDALENRIYERRGQGVLVETALQMQEFSGTTHFAECMAQASGGIFLALPRFEGIADMELLDAYTDLIADEGQFAKDFRDALADGKITRKEFEVLKDDIHAQQHHEMALLARIESLVAD
jgi:hypothetical protein